MKPSEIIHKLAMGIAKCQVEEVKKKLGALGKVLDGKLGSEEEQIRTLLPANTATAVAIYLDLLYNKNIIKHDKSFEDTVENMTVERIASLIRAGVKATGLMDDVLKPKEEDIGDTEK